MDAADAMEVIQSIPAKLSTLDATDHANEEPDQTTNEEAMQQLSLEPGEVPVRTPSATYHESPSTDPGSPRAPEDGLVNEEGEKETENKRDSSDPITTENTVPQNAEQATLDPPNPSTTLTTTTKGSTNETTTDTEMEENTPAIPEPTETPNNPTTEAPSSDPPTTDNTASSEPTAMDEDPNDEAADPETNANAVVKYVPPEVVDNADSPKAAENPDKGKGESKDAMAAWWGVAEAENSSLGGAENTGADSSDWRLNVAGASGWNAAGAGGGGGDTNTSSNRWETNGDSGSGGRTGGWGNRGKDRDSYGNRDRDRDRDRDSFRDGDGLLRRARPASFGNVFAGGSNAAPLLPPLGRSPVKNLNSDRHARLARSAPYPSRRETRSGDWGNAGGAGLDYGSGGLDYGSPGDGDDFGVIGGARGGGAGGINGNGPVVLSQKPLVLNEMDLSGLNTLSKTMNNADIKAITNTLMDHIGQIQKLRNQNIDAHNLVRQRGHEYTERKAELQASLAVESNPQKKAAIASKLEAHRMKGRAEETLLEATVLNTETAMKREVQALIHTTSEAMADKIHACILDVVRAVGEPGVGCDVEKVVERCVSIATPKLVRDQLGAQEKFIRRLERRVGQLDDSLQERDKTIVDLNRRLKRLEGKVVKEAEVGHDLMVTDTDTTSPGTSSTVTATTNGDSDSLAAPDGQRQSSNCVHQ